MSEQIPVGTELKRGAWTLVQESDDLTILGPHRIALGLQNKSYRVGEWHPDIINAFFDADFRFLVIEGRKWIAGDWPRPKRWTVKHVGHGLSGPGGWYRVENGDRWEAIFRDEICANMYACELNASAAKNAENLPEELKCKKCGQPFAPDDSMCWDNGWRIHCAKCPELVAKAGKYRVMEHRLTYTITEHPLIADVVSISRELPNDKLLADFIASVLNGERTLPMDGPAIKSLYADTKQEDRITVMRRAAGLPEKP